MNEAAQTIAHEEPLALEYPDRGILPHELPGVAGEPSIAARWLRKEKAEIPRLAEPEVVRHFVRLSHWNHSIETGFYPLGSCTMKYNPRLHEDLVRNPGFAELHPEQDDEDVQGLLRLLVELEEILAEITGMAAVSLQPAAGAHGELTGLLVIRKALQARGEGHRRIVLVPDSAHGTNPASATLAGMEVLELPSRKDGRLDTEALARVLAERGDEIACLMLTNPNTAGVFESEMEEIAARVHEAGGFVYGDGANLNALVGVVRPGDLGLDCLHINLHKTFATPHGGGGPGAGPLAVSKELAPFRPVPRLVREGSKVRVVREDAQAIGPVLGSLGHVSVLLKALAYIQAVGREHLHRIAEDAVLAANYIAARLAEAYHRPFPLPCKHEVLLTDKHQAQHGVKTLDIAKKLIDYGIHPMTIYFPLIVQGAMLIEPTETESKRELDRFCSAMLAIAEAAARGEAQKLHEAPTRAFRRRVDEVKAARKPVLVWPRQGAKEA